MKCPYPDRTCKRKWYLPNCKHYVKAKGFILNNQVDFCNIDGKAKLVETLNIITGETSFRPDNYVSCSEMKGDETED